MLKKLNICCILFSKRVRMPRQITQCPVCDAPVRVTELSCTACETRLQGTFPAAPLAELPAEHQRFIETFVLCRGVIRDVERELGVSYPTVRARLDAVVLALEAIIEPEPGSTRIAQRRDEHRRRLLREVEEGRLSPTEAAEALRRL